MKIRTSLVASIFLLVTLVAPTEALAVVQSLNSQTGQNQTFQNDSNVTISSSNNIHSLIWQGLLPVSRGGTGASSFTSGSIPFIFNGIFSQDNTNFFWDNTNKRLGIGTTSPSSALHVTSDALINSLTIGRGGGSISTNTALGITALPSNTTATDNTAVGNRAMEDTTTGGQNTAIGATALLRNTTGARNTAVGLGSLASNNSVDNTALGHFALTSNTSSGNVAIGYNAIYGNTTGNNIVAIGANTGGPQDTASNSIYIGKSAQGSTSDENNAIVIGNEQTTGAGTNTAVIGNSSMTDIYFGSANSNASIHGKKLYLGSSSIPGCIIVGDSDSSGVTYLTVNDGVLTSSTTAPSACQ
ncbi:hypothetical protein HYT32_02035 [Candidatus Roizmanbacteria bacterium]|nr:hypothetical protein [Candidatus Roizmanbacteria bacterium]